MSDVKTVTLISPNGQQVTVSEDKQAARLGAGYRLPGKATKATSKPGDPGPSKYDELKADDLKAEIEKRNDDGREDDAKLSTKGNKPDLVAALVGDDTRLAGTSGSTN